MKIKYFHFIYLIIILILSILYFQKNNQLKESDAMIERLGTQLSANEPILDGYIQLNYYQLDRNIGDFPIPQFTRLTQWLKNVMENNNKITKYLQTLQDDIIKNNKSYLNDNELFLLKDLLNANLDTLNNHSEYKRGLKELKYYKISQNENYIDSLSKLRDKRLFTAIVLLKNYNYFNTFMLVHGTNMGIVFEVNRDVYTVDLTNTKSTIIEGDTLNVGIALKKMMPKSYLLDWKLKVNGENMNFKNNEFIYNKIATKTGKYPINVTIYSTNTVTGQVKTHQLFYEYEVLPKCRRACQ